MDIINNTTLHIKAWQTAWSDELLNRGLSLLTYNARFATENAIRFKNFSNYIEADINFSKKLLSMQYSWPDYNLFAG